MDYQTESVRVGIVTHLGILHQSGRSKTFVAGLSKESYSGTI